ncbi:MAG: hypothetical protein M3457_22270 [Chloroflexota bacterium]|nr:hypothetical protein [Chloroflexota bacterium]
MSCRLKVDQWRRRDRENALVYFREHAILVVGGLIARIDWIMASRALDRGIQKASH